MQPTFSQKTSRRLAGKIETNTCNERANAKQKPTFAGILNIDMEATPLTLSGNSGGEKLVFKGKNTSAGSGRYPAIAIIYISRTLSGAMRKVGEHEAKLLLLLLDRFVAGECACVPGRFQTHPLAEVPSVWYRLHQSVSYR